MALTCLLRVLFFENDDVIFYQRWRHPHVLKHIPKFLEVGPSPSRVGGLRFWGWILNRIWGIESYLCFLSITFGSGDISFSYQLTCTDKAFSWLKVNQLSLLLIFLANLSCLVYFKLKNELYPAKNWWNQTFISQASKNLSQPHFELKKLSQKLALLGV